MTAKISSSISRLKLAHDPRTSQGVRYTGCMISHRTTRLLASLLIGLGSTFALISMSVAQEQPVPVSPKIAKIYDQNDRYVLFAAFATGGEMQDFKLWVRTKATNKVKLATNFLAFGKNPIVLDAVLKKGEATAYATLTRNDRKNRIVSSIIQVGLENGQTKRILQGDSSNFTFIDGGNKLLISSDNKYLFFTGKKISVNYVEQEWFRFGVLGTKNPKLEAYRGDLPHYEIDANNGCSVSVPAWETAKKDRRVKFENKAITIFSGKVTQIDFPDGNAFFTKKSGEAAFKCYDSNQFGKNPDFWSAAANIDGSLIYIVTTSSTTSVKGNNTEFLINRLAAKSGIIQRVLEQPKYKFDEISNLVISPNDRQLAFFAAEDGGFGVTPLLLTLGDFANQNQTKPRGAGLKVEPFPFDFKIINGFPCFSANGTPQTCSQ
jgi:hypothetical protein